MKAIALLPEEWAEVFVKYGDELREGAKMPDDVFKDFQNHCFHPPSWGGAPSACKKYWELMVQALSDKKCSEAIRYAGIASHYFSDVLNPTHTGQVPREQIVHKFIEWGVGSNLVSYGSRMALSSPLEVVDIEQLVRNSAILSHQYYGLFVDGYDLVQGERYGWGKGFSEENHVLNTALLELAVRGTAGLWILAIKAAGVGPPEVNMTVCSVIQAVKSPIARLSNFIESLQLKRVQNRQVEELRMTGTIEKTLTHDVVGKSQFYEELEKKGALRFRQQKTAALRPGATTTLQDVTLPPEAPAPAVKISTTRRKTQRRSTKTSTLTEAPSMAAPETATTVTSPPEPTPVTETIVETQHQHPVESGGAAEPKSRRKTPATVVTHAAEPKPSRARGPRSPHLTPSDPVKDAPGIGARTADALAKLGIKSVGDLLSRKASDIARELGDRRIDAERVRMWQYASRLMCEVPALYGHDAIILYNVGIRSRSELAQAEPKRLLEASVKYAKSDAAQREMRSMPIPDWQEVTNWIESAQSARSYLPEVAIA